MDNRANLAFPGGDLLKGRTNETTYQTGSGQNICLVLNKHCNV